MQKRIMMRGSCMGDTSKWSVADGGMRGVQYLGRQEARSLESSFLRSGDQTLALLSAIVGLHKQVLLSRRPSYHILFRSYLLHTRRTSTVL